MSPCAIDVQAIELDEEERELQKQLENVPKKDVLNMIIHIRSNDAFKASYMNMYSFTEIQKYVAEQIGVGLGEYIHVADSFHVYGSYFEEFKGFLNLIKQRTFEDRTYNSTSPIVIESFIEGCDELFKETDMPENKKELVRQRKIYLESLLK
jgi:hypothetical protein